MKNHLLPLILLILLYACDTTTTQKASAVEISLLPQPKEISIEQKKLILSENSKAFSADPNVYPLLELFGEELEKLTGKNLATTETNNSDADLVFSLNESLAKETFTIEINNQVKVNGGSYAALAMAKNTLLQIVEVENGNLVFPVLNISDAPDAQYRGLMIDLARQWHEMETIKKLIDLAAFYKLNYVQLHFTDYQSYTLPSKKLPKLATPDRHYRFEELAELETYSQARGITIIPELDVPGHSSQLVKNYPEIFAIQDTATNPWIINMGKEEVYASLDDLIGELTDIFTATPYFHIGGDEAIFRKVAEDPDVQAYIKKNGIGADVHELYRHFLVRMNEIVKKHDKQMCVWEGFTREGEIEIPKDIIVFEFETNRYLPNELIADGYTVVNTSWKPLYVVNQKKWAPKTIYEWNMWRWENWWEKAPSFEPIQVEKTPLIIGAQMCAWEQKGEVEISSLRKRLPVFLERIWNTEAQIPYDEMMKRLELTDQRLSLLIGDDRQDSLLVGYDW